jgi:hypothetical protein
MIQAQEQAYFTEESNITSLHTYILIMYLKYTLKACSSLRPLAKFTSYSMSIV